jgi:hypothetical protein
MIESRFSGEDCLLQRNCWPVSKMTKSAYITIWIDWKKSWKWTSEHKVFLHVSQIG